MADLLNDFVRASEKEKHLKCYSSLIRRSRPYTLDDDAVALITEIASGPTIAEKLGVYRILARLPFDVVWMELNYEARYNARVKLGTSVGDKPKDAPDRMGWLMERITETVWRATTVIRYEAGVTGSGRTVDTFGAVHVLSTEGKLDFRSFTRDPHMREAVKKVNAPDHRYPPLPGLGVLPREQSVQSEPESEDGVSIVQALAWGFGDERDGKKIITLPRHLAGSNAVDLPPSWEPIIERVSKGIPLVKLARTKQHMLDSAVELQGDLRFLCAALATINEVPITYTDVQQPGKTMIGGRIRPYMINRVVTIAVPKKRGRTNKVMKLLRLAERRMRRHEVGGYWKTVYSGPGRTIKERRWINEYMRGDSSLGFVRQEREIVESK